MTTIGFTTVTKRYGAVDALADVDLSIRAGTVHVLAGANGSGKTTILRLIAGLTDPTSGTIDRPTDRIGYAFQEPNVYPALSVRENIDVFATVTDADDAWLDRLFDVFRLHRVADRPASTLSDGYRKKLDLALAFADEPSIVLLDEPLADVDDLTAANLVDLLSTYRGPDRTIVLATHNVSRFSDLVDELTILHDGVVLATHSQPADPTAIYETTLADIVGDDG